MKYGCDNCGTYAVCHEAAPYGIEGAFCCKCSRCDDPAECLAGHLDSEEDAVIPKPRVEFDEDLWFEYKGPFDTDG